MITLEYENVKGDTEHSQQIRVISKYKDLAMKTHREASSMDPRAVLSVRRGSKKSSRVSGGSGNSPAGAATFSFPCYFLTFCA